MDLLIQPMESVYYFQKLQEHLFMEILKDSKMKTEQNSAVYMGLPIVAITILVSVYNVW